MTDAEVKAAYDELCRTFMVEDIRKGIDLATANVLVALGIFSYLEMLGGLITGQGALIRGPGAKNFKAALRHLPPGYRAIDRKLVITDGAGNQHKGVYAVVRCGLAHEYAPKGPVTINSTPNAAPVAGRLGLEVVQLDGSPRLIVNNNELFRDLKELIERIGIWVDTRDPTHYPDIKAVFDRVGSYSLTV